MIKTIPVKEVAIAVVVNPSKTSTLWSGTSHVAVLHHPPRGKLVKVARGKMDTRVCSNEDEEGENEHNWLHVGDHWEKHE